jgi:predicted metal-dependent hydrolase
MIDWLRRAVVEPEIELNGATVPILLHRHPTAKRLTLRLTPDGAAVKITLPRWANANEALAFAHAREPWLAQQHARIPRRTDPAPGGDLHYRGAVLRLAWDASARRKPVLGGGQLVLGGPPESYAARIRRWLEREAISLFASDLRDYCAAAGLAEVPIGLSRAQRRWGSCSDGGQRGTKRIRINWRLVQAPDFVRRSVVAHEVTHLVHFDHSAAFHAMLGTIYEGDIKAADRWLKQHGRSLYASFG